jgi:hypothetical protein
MKNNFDIGITTFSLRYDFIHNLIQQIKSLNIQNNIYLAINGEKNSQFDESYRQQILKLCLSYENIFPIFFTEIRGLSKLWNTLIVHSSKEDILLLNDDINIYSSNIFNVVSDYIENNPNYGLTTINNTFSFFVVNHKFINELGYFDERLLGFGEEDGDILYRIIKKTGKTIERLNVSGVENIVSDVVYDHIKKGMGKYSLFNRNFIFNEKYQCNGNIYYFPENIECEQKLNDQQLYPYESFFRENKKLL